MENLINDLRSTLAAFESTFLSCPKEQINEVPFPGSWTVGQLVKHMAMANDGFTDVFNGPTTETSRPADLNATQIKTILEDLNNKMKSPDFVYPILKDYDYDRLHADLRAVENKLTNIIGKLDWTKTCTAFELPVFGYLTRLEVVYFIVYHTRRHTHQLNKMIEQLKNAKTETV